MLFFTNRIGYNLKNPLDQHTMQGIMQKKYGRIGSWKSQNRLKLGLWGELYAHPGGLGRCLGESVGENPLNSFTCFLVKHARMVIVRVNIG